MYFKIFKAKNEQFYFNGYGNNHEIILTSEMYKTKQAALNTVDAIKSQAEKAEVKDETEKK
ncbi:YegP family protein [Fusobacterium sp.]|uniref:YegP family protein n=1 Tax=Fusobacterium sp. TaxID=68766 RepID=UPI002904D756|nr:YegP family protein [Fusobacterium sp.]MDU1912351.1 YegP family protein [Fusobacterium sp.]